MQKKTLRMINKLKKNMFKSFSHCKIKRTENKLLRNINKWDRLQEVSYKIIKVHGADMDRIYKMELSPPNNNKSFSKLKKENNKKFNKLNFNKKTLNLTISFIGNSFMIIKVFHMLILLLISNLIIQQISFQKNKFKHG